MIIALLIVTLVSLGIDWLQTLYIAKHPEEYEEISVFLGKHPTTKAATQYFAARAVFTAIIGLATNELFAGVYLSIVLIIELVCVIHNYENGIRIKNLHIGETGSLVEFWRQWKLFIESIAFFIVVVIALIVWSKWK